jgi:hypothetical protein
MEGKPLNPLEVEGATVLREDQPRSPIVGPHQSQNAVFDYTPEEQKLIEQRLADLGYLE